jgi:chaperonin cofactor prefoldin
LTKANKEALRGLVVYLIGALIVSAAAGYLTAEVNAGKQEVRIEHLEDRQNRDDSTLDALRTDITEIKEGVAEIRGFLAPRPR